MQIESNKSLKNYNTFGIDCAARYFVSVNTIQELKTALKSKIHKSLLILGGGSNLLLTKDVDALVIHLNIKGISITSEDDDFVHLSVKGGENWHELVLYCLEKDYGGLENLSLIPGNVGTAPIQNIGAYGVELKDVFENCTGIAVTDGTERIFSKSDCQFEYRNSVFKNELKGKYIITEVVFKLSKKNHSLHKSYGAIQQLLEEASIESPTIQDISQAIIKIRQSKLPDPKEIGNSGSFFKNPVISLEAFKEFSKYNPEVPYYVVSDTEVKIPAGWLIEQAGFKGKRFGDAGVHHKQALVLVNHGNAKGKELLALSQKIQQQVLEQFNISIYPEVNIL